MLAGLGRLIHRRRWTSLALILILTVMAGVWGIGVLAKFKQGGFEDPKASSTLVAKLGSTYFGNTNPDILLLIRSETMTVDDPRYMAAVLGSVARLPKSHIAEIHSYWAFEGKYAAPFASRDKHSTIVALKVASADDLVKVEKYTEIKDRLTVPGMDVKVGGLIALGSEFSEQVVTDIVAAETVSMPILLVLLVVVFGALTAAVLPLVVAIFSIVGGLAVLHLMTFLTDVTATALEVVTMMGVGLAIDYSLFVVSRFREEIAKDGDRSRALAVTMATAGRTIAVSGITVTAALSGLLLFPQLFLRTIGLAGMATVMVAVFGAVVLLPTLLALLGPKVEFGRMPWRRKKGGGLRAKDYESGFWYRLGNSVMKRPLPYFAITLVILAVLFGPFLNAQFGAVDARVLPKDSPTRAVAETVKAEFPNGSAEPIDVVISGDLIPRNWRPVKKDELIPPYLEGFRKRLESLPHVVEAQISGYSQEYGGVRISVTHSVDPMSAEAQSLVQTIRGMTVVKDGLPQHLDIGGSTAAQMDLMSSIMRTLPKMALLVGTTTFVLLFMFFGSVLLPIKAIAMNVLSIGASFGVIVWGFQYGHLAGLLDFTPVGSVEATTMIMVLAVIFGLSMDYEVFLLSRIREEWDRTHDNRKAVAVGMQRTGSIITSAALLFLVVIAGFGMAGITVVKLIGVGMFVAVVVDALLVRSLLVPATMRYMGDANWWIPKALAGLHAKMDLRERDVYDEDETNQDAFELAPDEPDDDKAVGRREKPVVYAAAVAQEMPPWERDSAPAPAPAPAPARRLYPDVPPQRPAEPVRSVAPERAAGNGGRWSPWAEGRPEPRPAPPPKTTRRIVPNPDGPGWHWSSVEDDDAG